MRCFEQVRVNLALLSEVRELNVNLIGVGAGYSYVVSGPTHQCLEDLSIMRTLPNMQVYSLGRFRRCRRRSCSSPACKTPALNICALMCSPSLLYMLRRQQM